MSLARILHIGESITNKTDNMKYEYVNGERRYFKRVAIWYDANGNDGKHWYIRHAITLQDCNDTCHTGHICNKYFKTIADAKKYIDGVLNGTIVVII